MGAGSSRNGRKRQRRANTIPKDDPRRQALLEKEFLQDGYIEGISDYSEPADDAEQFGNPGFIDDSNPMFDDSDAISVFDKPEEGFAEIPDMDMFEQTDAQTFNEIEEDYAQDAAGDAPSDTGSFLGGGDTDWAAGLIGNDDFDYADSDYALDYVDDDEDVSAPDDTMDTGTYEDTPEGYGTPDMLDVTAMSQEQFMTPIPIEQTTFRNSPSGPEAFQTEEPAGVMPPMAGVYPSQSGMGDDMYQQQPQQQQQQPPAPMPPAPMPAPPLPEEHEHHDKHRRERHHGRIFKLVKRIILLLLLILVFVGGFALGLMYEQNQHPSVSAAFIETQLSECSDLATAKMHYNGLVHYESGDIPLINKKSFSMTYQAEVRAGIDLSQADVKVSNGTITITLPQATVQTTAIDPASVKFFDQTWGLFSWESKDDAKTALEQAQKDLDGNLDDMRLVDEANLNAERTVRGLIAPILKMNDGYKLDIKVQP